MLKSDLRMLDHTKEIRDHRMVRPVQFMTENESTYKNDDDSSTIYHQFRKTIRQISEIIHVTF